MANYFSRHQKLEEPDYIRRTGKTSRDDWRTPPDPSAPEPKQAVPVADPSRIVEDPFAQQQQVQNISNTLAQNGLSSEYLEKLKANQAKLAALETMPIRDENGRVQSGLKAVVERLDNMFNGRGALPITDMRQIYQGVAAAGTTMIGGMIFPEIDERSSVKREKAKILQENQYLMEMGEKDLKIQQESRKANLNAVETMVDIDGKVEKQTRDKAQEYIDSIKADDYVSEEEAAEAKKRGIEMQPYDARQFEHKDRNGRVLKRQKKGEGAWEVVSELGIKKSEVEGEYEFNGKTYWLEGKDADNLDKAIQEGNARRQLQILQGNTRIENDEIEAEERAERDFNKEVQDTVEKNNKINNERIKLVNDGNALLHQGIEEGDEEKIQKGRAMTNQAANLKALPMPKKNQVKKRKRILQKISMDVVKAYAKAKNVSLAEAKKAASADGYEIEGEN